MSLTKRFLIFPDFSTNFLPDPCHCENKFLVARNLEPTFYLNEFQDLRFFDIYFIVCNCHKNQFELEKIA